MRTLYNQTEIKLYNKLSRKIARLLKSGTPSFMLYGEMSLTANSAREDSMVREMFNITSNI